jgi:hypothetical protein
MTKALLKLKISYPWIQLSFVERLVPDVVTIVHNVITAITGQAVEPLGKA